jgi:hypothetical protein
MSNQKQTQFLKMYEPVHEQFERFCRASVYGDMQYSDLINTSLLAAYENIDELKKKSISILFVFNSN